MILILITSVTILLNSLLFRVLYDNLVFASIGFLNVKCVEKK